MSDDPDIVLARRQMIRPDGSPIAVDIPEEETCGHADTNCFIFYRTPFDVAIKWSPIPRQTSFMDDRLFYALLTQKHPEQKTALNEAKTVGYTCLRESIYRLAGGWRGLDAYGKQVLERTLGLPILLSEDAPGRVS